MPATMTKPKALRLRKPERIIIYVKDFARAVKFYTQTLGMPLRHSEEGWAALGDGDTELDLHGGRTKKAREGEFHVGFRVDDLDATVAALKARGVKVGKIGSPCEGLRYAGFTDPDGNQLSVEGK
jgi:catechol 2,3-dioxygenase-like lactoylglutathione lyase family enzyme